MNIKDIEYLWKGASNNPHHDTNWHDPVVIAFAESVAAHTLMNIDPSNFMSHQEGFEAGRVIEREACAALYAHEDVQAPVGNSAWGEAYQDGWIAGAQAYRDAIRARGNT
jgi:hypothetical protein